MDDPEGLSIAEFVNHPSFRSTATFFLGFVFISCIHYTHRVPALVVRYIRARFLGRRARSHGGFGIEANRAYGDEKVHGWLGYPEQSSSLSTAPKSNNLALSLTICFAMWSVAEFGSLLVFGTRGQAGCAFLVAWGGMAAQAARLLGLLKLSLDLKKMGVPKWETFIFWGWLLFALVMMFVSNAISIGTIRQIASMPDSTLCFRKHFLATAVVSSVANVIMETYCLIRFHYLLVPAFLSAEHKLDAALDVRTSRALSLLILEIATAVPAAKFFSVLADVLPASIGALLVLVAFNQRSPQIYLATTASIPPTRPESVHSRSTIEIKKMPSTQSLANHDPRVSHPFAASALQDPSPETEDWPASQLPHLPSKSYLPYPESTAPPSSRRESIVSPSRRESTAPPSSRRHTWRTSGQSSLSESDSVVARSVKGAIVAFASKEQVGERTPRTRERRSFLPPIPTMPSMSEGTQEPNAVFPRSTPLRIPKPTVPPAIRVADLERASTEPGPRPQISITTATPVVGDKPTSAVTRASVPTSVPSNYSEESKSLHLTPVTPGARSQPSHRTSSSSDSAWRYDTRHDSLGTDPERGSEESSRRQSGSGLPPADDDLSIVYEASHEDSDSLPPSRRAHRPTFGEHMFVQGGLGRTVSPPADVPQDVHPEGDGGSSGSAKSASVLSGNRI